jgi:hypothetical protein
MVPDRAGADTQVIAHIPLRELRGMDGASALEEGWIAARLGDSRFLAGKNAEAAACDALIVPVVTVHHGRPAAGHRVFGEHPGAHPPRRRAAGPGLCVAAVPAARRGLRCASCGAQERRRQDLCS